MTKSIWILADDRPGHVAQSIGLAEKLGAPYEIKKLEFNFLAQLPNQLLYNFTAGLTVSCKNKIKGPYPDLVIATGRKTAPVAQHIKNKSEGKTKIIQIMHPDMKGLAAFDLICLPKHDRHELKSNFLEIIGAPNKITPKFLAQNRARYLDKYKKLGERKIALIVGGATKRRVFTAEMAQKLGKEINEVAVQEQAGLLITTSRRTGVEATKALLNEITQPAIVYCWGDEGENPYFAFLACADKIIVTGDSVSMCGEACSTGKPVYIYAPKEMVSAKHQRMVMSFIQGHHAFLFDGNCQKGEVTPLDCTMKIIERIKQDGLF